MTRSNTLGWIILFFVALLFLSSSPLMLASETVSGYPQQEKPPINKR